MCCRALRPGGGLIRYSVGMYGTQDYPTWKRVQRVYSRIEAVFQEEEKSAAHDISCVLQKGIQ